MNGAEAERIAFKALTFLAADAERLGRFLGSTGLAPQELRDKADDPELLAGVLDYLLSDEAMVIEFCRTLEVQPGMVSKARGQLPGYSPPM